MRKFRDRENNHLITIKEAITNQELVAFMEFPLTLYKGNPYYVPDILTSQVADMDKNRNPAFAYCDAKCFLAYRDGTIVGRICGILNRKANEKFGKHYMNFSHVDFIDDDEVVDALFGAVEAWAKELGCEAVHGPLGFSDMDREGLLVEGFDRKSLFYTYYNHPYYVTQLTRLGYEKQVDWIELRIKIPEAPDKHIEKLSDYIKAKKHLRVVGLKDKPLHRLMRDVFGLFNETYRVLFGVVPMTDAQMEKYTKEFLPMIKDRTCCFIYDAHDEIAAFGIACPALDDAMIKIKGRTTPFGWIHLLKALNGKNDTVDMLLIAVRPDLQGTGVNAIILDEMQKKLIAAKVRYAETGPMLELNTRVQAQWERFEHEQHKRRRCFVKELQ